MGLFGKKEPCPICGGEVKGLFNNKVEGKKMCKACSGLVSMHPDILRATTVDSLRTHLEYRRQNLEKFNSLQWDTKISVWGDLKVGVDLNARCLYLIHVDMDDFENPVVLSFDQLTYYELYRMTSRVDDSDTPGATALESTLSVMSGIAKMIDSEKNNSDDYIRLVLHTSEPYWPRIEVRFSFTNPDHLYGMGGFAPDLTRVCQLFKRAIRKETITVV